jgi:hypothetical protein
MNRRGNTETLVASHPGNVNAGKKGVYSRRMLAPRVAEVEGQLASRTPALIRRDVARSDLSGLIALNEALDAALADGVIGKRGQVKDLVRVRLRASSAIRSAAHEYEAAVAAIDEPSTVDNSIKPIESPEPFAAVKGDLFAELVQLFWGGRPPQVDPISFDAELFLMAIAETTDPAVRSTDRNRADRLLLTCRAARDENCTCGGTLRARGTSEFLAWIARLASVCEPVVEGDRYLASVVRTLGSRMAYEPPQPFRLQHAAVLHLVDYERRRARGGDCHEGGPAEAVEDKRIQRLASDRTVHRFWGTALSFDEKSAKDRLDAFEKLERADALRRCACPQAETGSPEGLRDAFFASVIRLLGRTTFAGAEARLCFPESLAAAREISDRRILADRGVDLPESEVIESVRTDGGS